MELGIERPAANILSRMSETVGFIGLGLMGRPMAKNILKKGYPLVVHSRSQGPVDDLVAAGATRAASPADVARQATRIITMVPDSPDVELVLDGPNGVFSALQPGTIIIDMSSIAPGPARRLAERAKALGATMLDAPVSGGDIGAIAGTLSIMVGGDLEAFNAVKPLLDAMGNPGEGRARRRIGRRPAVQTVQPDGDRRHAGRRRRSARAGAQGRRRRRRKFARRCSADLRPAAYSKSMASVR